MGSFLPPFLCSVLQTLGGQHSPCCRRGTEPSESSGSCWCLGWGTRWAYNPQGSGQAADEGAMAHHCHRPPWVPVRGHRVGCVSPRHGPCCQESAEQHAGSPAQRQVSTRSSGAPTTQDLPHLQSSALHPMWRQWKTGNSLQNPPAGCCASLEQPLVLPGPASALGSACEAEGCVGRERRQEAG